MKPITKQSLKLISIWGIFSTICAVLFIMAITDSFPTSSGGQGATSDNISSSSSDDANTDTQYSSWRDCVAVEFQAGNITYNLVVKNICKDKLKKVEIKYYVGGYEQSDIRTASFYNVSPNDTQSQPLGVRDPNILLALYDVSIEL